MKAFLGSIFTVIAMGVVVIAYGVLSPRLANTDALSGARPMVAAERVGVADDGTVLYSYSNNGMVWYVSTDAVACPAVYDTYTSVSRRVVSMRRLSGSLSIERPRGRDWTKTALMI